MLYALTWWQIFTCLQLQDQLHQMNEDTSILIGQRFSQRNKV